MEKPLAYFSPAETLSLLREGRGTFKELIKITFTDLLLRKVLHARREAIEETSWVYYVKPGVNYSSHPALAHETFFLKPFSKSRELEMTVRHFIAAVVQRSFGQSHFNYTVIRKNKKLYPEFMRRKFFSGHRLTSTGMELKQKVEETLEKTALLFPRLVKESPAKALEILTMVGGNILLMPNFSFEMLKELDVAIQDLETGTDSFGYLDPGLWAITFDGGLDGIMDGFDGGWDAGAGDSGGDGGGCGASGCGGCGGGGCGS